MTPNPLLVDVASPPIPEAQSWRARYGGAHGPFVDLAQAVPGYPPHPDMLAALAEAAGRPAAASYGPILGDEALRAAYAAHVSGIYGARVGADEVAITTGCNMAFFVAAVALAQRGDAVLVPSPWYFNHEMTLSMLGVEARALPCRAETGFLPDPDEAERLIDGRVRAILLVTPNNPTGAVYPPELIARFAELAARRGVVLILDETYRDFLADGAPHHALRPGAPVLQLYSFSKSYCIPGHRLGAMVAPKPLIGEIAKVLDCMQICAPRVGQIATAPMIERLADWRAGNRAAIARRADAFRAAIGGSNGWRIDSIGAYFAFVAHPDPGERAVAAAERLAAERGVLALPGSYFGPGNETHLRFAFANADETAIAEVGRRLARAA